MIVVDTNIVAEPIKPRPDPSVMAWIDEQAIETLYLTATSLSELLYGVEILPGGKRKRGLRSALVQSLESLFATRILAFDRAAANVYAPLVASARSAGATVSVADGQIAAIATVHGYTVATRDAAPFEAAGVPVINPWRASSK